jgi:hypothetical protein
MLATRPHRIRLVVQSVNANISIARLRETAVTNANGRLARGYCC